MQLEIIILNEISPDTGRKKMSRCHTWNVKRKDKKERRLFGKTDGVFRGVGTRAGE